MKTPIKVDLSSSATNFQFIRLINEPYALACQSNKSRLAQGRQSTKIDCSSKEFWNQIFNPTRVYASFGKFGWKTVLSLHVHDVDPF